MNGSHSLGLAAFQRSMLMQEDTIRGYDSIRIATTDIVDKAKVVIICHIKYFCSMYHDDHSVNGADNSGGDCQQLLHLRAGAHEAESPSQRCHGCWRRIGSFAGASRSHYTSHQLATDVTVSAGAHSVGAELAAKAAVSPGEDNRVTRGR
jgi:hypothetical protein